MKYNGAMFGEWLDGRMVECGLSQVELAKAVGVSQQAVSLWRKGMGRPAGQRIGKLATMLNVDVNEVILELERHGQAGRLDPEPREDASLESQVRELTDRVRRLERLIGVRGITPGDISE